MLSPVWAFYVCNVVLAYKVTYKVALATISLLNHILHIVEMKDNFSSNLLRIMVFFENN